MVRHKDIKTTLDVGRASEWNDDHISDFTVIKPLEDSLVVHDLVDNWDLTVNATGVAGVITFQDHHTLAFLDGGAANDDWSCMRWEIGGAAGNITYLVDAPIFTAAVWIDAYNPAGNVAEWGLQNNAVAPFTANQDGAYFRIEDGLLLAVTGSGAAETTTDVTPLAGIPEYGHYRIELTGSNAIFYVDDMETSVATHTLTLPDSDLTVSFATQTLGGTRANMYVDAVGLTINRYQG